MRPTHFVSVAVPDCMSTCMNEVSRQICIMPPLFDHLTWPK